MLRRFIPALSVLALALALGAAPQAEAGGGARFCQATLWAGQHHDAGTLTVHQVGNVVYFTYATHGGWTLSEIHLHVAANLAGVPANKGGPIPGRFRYKSAAGGTTHTVAIPCDQLPRGDWVVLAHAVVHGGGGSPEPCDTVLVLPEGCVDTCSELTLEGPAFARTQIQGAGVYDGTYPSWCVDMDRPMDCNVEAFMVSSLDPSAQALVDRGENLDLVNYLLNGDYSFLGAGRDEIQAVLWLLLDDLGTNSGLWAGIAPDEDVVAAVLAEVEANGDGFVPGPGQKVAVLLYPKVEAQTMLITLDQPECPPPSGGGEETAWAGDRDFPGRNWAYYFVCPAP